MENDMNNLGRKYCDVGMRLFDQEKYDASVSCLIRAYELGYEREAILDHLYSCFIRPNEQEFRQYYADNSREMTQFPYEQCSLDFIPVTEDKFYIFDREKGVFEGAIRLEQEPVRGIKTEFHSILYTDIWDIREILPKLKETNWGTVYILLNEQEPGFLSFFKLPGFKDQYLDNVVLFKDTATMCAFFEEYEEFYLPKELVTLHAERYAEIIRKLHEKRIQSPRKKQDQVFLSICIPSYNRGGLALESVRRLLSCVYDSEIEIIVSNNGSTKDEDGYREIQEIGDSRLRYHEFDENQGYVTNVITVLEMAKGRYAILSSDEDLMVLENLGKFMTCLQAHPTGGVFYECGMGPNFPLPQENGTDVSAGWNAVSRAINLNYITGITYNMDLLRSVHAFETVSAMRGNKFVETYVQIVFAVIAGKYMDFHDTNILLWDGRRAGGKNINRRVLSYMLPGSRVGQLEAAIDFLCRGLHMEGAGLLNIFIERCQKTYYLLLIAYCNLDDYPKICSWEEICLFVYQKNMNYLEQFPVLLKKEEQLWLEEQIKQVFLRNLFSENAVKLCPSEEKKKREFHQIIRDGIEAGGTVESLEELFPKYWDCRGMKEESDWPAWDA